MWNDSLNNAHLDKRLQFCGGRYTFRRRNGRQYNREYAVVQLIVDLNSIYLKKSIQLAFEKNGQGFFKVTNLPLHAVAADMAMISFPTTSPDKTFF